MRRPPPGPGHRRRPRARRPPPRLDFHLVGGTGQDRAPREHRAHGANVHFHDHRPPSRPDPYHRAFDIALAPYQPPAGDATGAASPVTLFAYMAHGKAIVASDLPALREVLADGVDCLLRPPDDVAAWADAVGRLAADPAARAALGAAAHRHVMEHHTWRVRADRVLAGVGRPS
ncbi:glycosyltransferase [Streptomyces albireticuli]|uniref:glycosyltransferase n=1 Tax=Streptomyces albireticuli TaxID=1940 RepID=UPI001F42FBA0|nr:glycosyltransferase [Streptomyces albireticuli]